MKKVTYAVLHTTVHIPGVGQFGPTLSKLDQQNKANKLDMVYTDEGLELSGYNKKLLIPKTNIICVEFEK